MTPIIDCHNHVGVELLLWLNDWYPYGQQADSLALHRQHDIAHWVVFPCVSYSALDLAGLQRGEIILPDNADVPYAFENRRLLEEIRFVDPHLAPPEAFIPFAMLDPARRQKDQVSELRALYHEYPFAGLKTQPTIIRAPILNLLEDGSVFLDLAEELDLPFLIHTGVSPSEEWSRPEDILQVVEARPGIRFILAHSCRFDKPSLDRIAELPNAWFDCSAHGIHCLGATKGLQIVAQGDRLFPSDYSRPGQVLIDLAEAYPDKLIWGSDSPYYSWRSKTEKGWMELPSTYEKEVSYVREIPEPLQRKVAFENAIRFLGPRYEHLLS